MDPSRLRAILRHVSVPLLNIPVWNRRKTDAEAVRGGPGLPHYVLYPAIGFLLGLGSPVGAFLMRYYLAEPILKLLWMRHELEYNALFYVYMGTGTAFSFVLFGYVLGLRSERQRVRNRVLDARVKDLHLKSVTDALTGAFSHGYMQEILELELQKALTEKSPLSVVMLDIDDFKRINDTHGHLFGDRVIREAVESISTSIRDRDILGRYGGDEFMVVMPGAGREVAAQVAERIHRAIGGSGALVTVSVGTATYDGQDGAQAAELLARADENLYRAKRSGKNRAVGEQ